MFPAGILLGSFLYERLANAGPMTSSGYPVLILLWGAGYLLVNYLFVVAYFALSGQTQLQQFWHSMPRPLLFEMLLVPFAPLVARIYTDLGWDYFVFLMLAIVFITYIVRNLNDIGLHLDRRVLELDSLKNVGQTLSAGLEIEPILAAIHVQVTRLMPSDSFYIALLDAARNEVSFPLAVDGGQPVQIAERRVGNGLVEYVVRQKRPLLIPQNVTETAANFGLHLNSKEPACWLGVPILLAGDSIGAIVVQSYKQPNLYDDWHQDVLVALASQAAMAIQNARLYAQAGSEIARQVRELNSILSTIHEGILLLNLTGEIVTTNRVFTEFVELPEEQIVGQPLIVNGQATELMTKIGYELADWEQDCADLRQGEKWRTFRIEMKGATERQVERTLVPVRDAARGITNWLLIFRDITEETELAQSREETIHMLVHDLRSPLSVTLGSLETIHAWLKMGRTDDVQKLLDLAHDGGQRMLQILNNLLDSYKFENGSVRLNIEPLPVMAWLTEVQAQFAPAAANAGLTITVEVEPDLPLVGGDREHMIRVLSNLVDNAVKFTPDGGHINLWASLIVDDGMNSVLVGVSDTGLGIPPEAQERLFVKFQQNANARGRRQGTGLGLTYCKLVVEAHNGRIWVESEGVPGKGSTFLMVLPVYDNSRSLPTEAALEKA
ncbi:MAG: ATP-binding protein [Anaerolineae bacterium]